MHMDLHLQNIKSNTTDKNKKSNCSILTYVSNQM